MISRRRFLRVFGLGTTALAVAHALPSTIFPETAAPLLPPAPTSVVSQQVGMRGLPYIVNDMGDYFGISRDWQRRAEQVSEQFLTGFTDTEYAALEASYRPLIPEDYRRGKVV